MATPTDAIPLRVADSTTSCVRRLRRRQPGALRIGECHFGGLFPKQCRHCATLPRRAGSRHFVAIIGVFKRIPLPGAPHFRIGACTRQHYATHYRHCLQRHLAPYSARSGILVYTQSNTEFAVWSLCHCCRWSLSGSLTTRVHLAAATSSVTLPALQHIIPHVRGRGRRRCRVSRRTFLPRKGKAHRERSCKPRQRLRSRHIRETHGNMATALHLAHLCTVLLPRGCIRTGTRPPIRWHCAMGFGLARFKKSSRRARASTRGHLCSSREIKTGGRHGRRERRRHRERLRKICQKKAMNGSPKRCPPRHELPFFISITACHFFKVPTPHFSLSVADGLIRENTRMSIIQTLLVTLPGRVIIMRASPWRGVIDTLPRLWGSGVLNRLSI